jgi:Carbohydrate binding domain
MNRIRHSSSARPVETCNAGGLVTLALLMLALPCSAQNMAQNPGFESGTSGWFNWGPVTFTSATALPHTGSRSALVQNRTGTWNGVAQSLLGVLQPTNTYRISAWVRLVSGSSQPVLLTIQKVDSSATDPLVHNPPRAPAGSSAA